MNVNLVEEFGKKTLFRERQMRMNNNPNNPETSEVILEIGIEGGSCIIKRSRTADGNWKFVFMTDESAMADFLDKDDPIELVHTYPAVDSFEEALHLMDIYPWQEFYVVYVLKEYEELFTSEKKKRATSKGN